MAALTNQPTKFSFADCSLSDIEVVKFKRCRGAYIPQNARISPLLHIGPLYTHQDIDSSGKVGKLCFYRKRSSEQFKEDLEVS